MIVPVLVTMETDVRHVGILILLEIDKKYDCFEAVKPFLRQRVGHCAQFGVINPCQ